MLEYSKLILQKVAFDEHLFQKEFKKAIRKLSDEDVQKLMLWCDKHFNAKASSTLINKTTDTQFQTDKSIIV